MTASYRLITTVFALAASAAASAAPLDALLSARPERTEAVEVELGYDTLNDSLDVFDLREDKGASTSAVGDYKGGHVRAGVAITPKLWIDGAYWKRNIDYRSFDAKLKSWQLAGQYQVFEGEGRVPTVAVRLGAWGNSADSLTKYTNTTVSGTLFTDATVTKPRDTQLQFDLIGSWMPTEQTTVSVFGGGGKSRVEFDTVSARSRTKNGCEYNIAFSPEGLVGELAKPCNASVVVTRFALPASESIDVYKEAKYDATFVQVGMNGDWQSGDWRVRIGYQYQSIKRDNVDDILERRNQAAYKHSHVLVTDVTYSMLKNVNVFVRGQLMSNQFNGEIPMAYNSLTAEKYGQKYGFISTGLSIIF